MNEINKYAIITAKHQAYGQIDIRVSRDIPVKEIIRNLFDALGWDKKTLNGYYGKSHRSRILLDPKDTLRDKEIYDGDIIQIL